MCTDGKDQEVLGRKIDTNTQKCVDLLISKKNLDPFRQKNIKNKLE